MRKQSSFLGKTITLFSLKTNLFWFKVINNSNKLTLVY